MIEELPETPIFSKLRVPLTDFIDFPAPKVVRDDIRRPVALEHPLKHFRSRPGFYLTSDFTTKFWSFLTARPAIPDVSSLFVWTLRKSCTWAAVMQKFEGKNQSVPWWVIRPYLTFASHADRQLTCSSHCMPFFMEVKGAGESSIKAPVALRLHYGMSSEWWLSLFTLKGEEECHQGQIFLSVA